MRGYALRYLLSGNWKIKRPYHYNKKQLKKLKCRVAKKCRGQRLNTARVPDPDSCQLIAQYLG